VYLFLCSLIASVTVISARAFSPILAPSVYTPLPPYPQSYTPSSFVGLCL
jgi:hypothetical protein